MNKKALIGCMMLAVLNFETAYAEEIQNCANLEISLQTCEKFECEFSAISDKSYKILPNQNDTCIYEENTKADDPDILDIAYQIPGYFADTKNLNARLSWASHDEQWQLAVWGKNLTDNTTVGGLGGFAAAALGTPWDRW